MSSSDYKSISGRHEAIFRDKGSKFIAIALPFNDENELKDLLIELKKEHPKANHLCYAYRYDWEHPKHRANDDGEPSGSAGLPILGQIKSNDMLDILIVVIRYFGGTKLGVSGLKNAYKTSANLVLENLPLFYKTMNRSFRIQFPYDQTNFVDKICKQHDIHIVQKQFDQQISMQIQVPVHAEEACMDQLGPYLISK